jgi:transglutaminase-like putative cysteine protease
MPVYRIHHVTTYRHGAPANAAWQSVRLRPRDEDSQTCLEFDLDIFPRPTDLTERTDYHGNHLHVFTVRTAHQEFTVNAQSLVNRTEPVIPMAELTPPVSEVDALSDAAVLSGEFLLEQFRHPTAAIPRLAEAASLAASVDTDAPALTWMQSLGERFARNFMFDSTATDVSTPLAEVLRLRRGVCQDFAHLYIACARSLGLPAAYVSGYLLTQPPPGQPRFIGADAMHAWVSIHVPGTGWVDYDPTNHCFAGAGHIVVARGRDYTDVSPVRGVFNGGGQHSLRLGVTVEPVEHPADI